LTAGVVCLLLAAFTWRRSLEIQYHLHQGKVFLESRRIERAVGHFDAAVTLDSANGEARFYLARAYRLSGNINAMALNLRESAALGFSEKRVKAEDCFAMAQSGQFLPVQRQIESLFLDPGEDGRELCEAVSIGYLQTFQIPQALAVIQAWKRDYPEDSRPWLVEGMYYLEGALWARALAEFEEGLKISPGAIDLLLQLGRVRLELNQLPEAVAAFECCLREAPHNVEALSGLATAKFKMGFVDDAGNTAAAALAFDSRHFDSLCLLGQIHLAKNEPEKALSLLEAAYGIKPFDPAARYHYAMALRRTSDLIKADEILRASEEQHQAQSKLRDLFSQLSSDPQNAEVRLEIGRILVEHGDPAEGIAVLRSVFLFDPSNSEAIQLIASATSGSKDEPIKANVTVPEPENSQSLP